MKLNFPGTRDGYNYQRPKKPKTRKLGLFEIRKQWMEGGVDLPFKVLGWTPRIFALNTDEMPTLKRYLPGCRVKKYSIEG